MSGALGALVLRFEQEGARRFSRWNGALYRAACAGCGARWGDEAEGSGPLPGAGPVRALWDRIGGERHAPAVMEAYLRLLVEAIGMEVLDAAAVFAFPRAEAQPAAANLLSLLLVEKIPRLFPAGPADAQLGLLAQAWNLGEGLLAEAPWLNRYVASALSPLASLDDLDEQLVRALEPALLASAPASFQGPFAVTTLSAREVDAVFLPGAMHLAAPAVLCVHDRKREGVHAGVFLRPGGASSFMPLTPCLGVAAPDVENAGLPAASVAGGSLRIGGLEVPVPFLQRGHEVVVCRAGFVVASALDSQRLWVVETP